MSHILAVGVILLSCFFIFLVSLYRDKGGLNLFYGVWGRYGFLVSTDSRVYKSKIFSDAKPI